MSPNRSIIEKALKVGGSHSFFDFSAIFGRPAALLILPYIYPTFLSPIQVTILATAAGFGTACLIVAGSQVELVAAAVLLQIKNILDTLDGHLARARNQPSRVGSLLDSDTDFLTNFLIFCAIGYHLSGTIPTIFLVTMVVFALISSLIQCSYFIHYLHGYLAVARGEVISVAGKFPPDDLPSAGTAAGIRVQKFLETFYRAIYGWQDFLIRGIDTFSVNKSTHLKDFVDWNSDGRLHAWYSRKDLLKYHSAMGLGTQLFILSIMTAVDRLDLYLFIPSIAGNIYLIWNILIRIRRAGTE